MQPIVNYMQLRSGTKVEYRAPVPKAKAATHLYFAYGSNLSSNFLKERLKDGEWLPDGWHKTGKLIGPVPKDLGTFTLSDYEFGYTLDLQTETAGNIVPKKGARVYGVLYRISASQLAELDKSEDVPRDYTRVAVKVSRVALSKLASEEEAWTYVGNPKLVTDQIHPDPEYVELLVSSATARNFPKAYIDQYLRVPPEKKEEQDDADLAAMACAAQSS